MPGSLRVLIIDDSEDFRMIYSRLLKKSGLYLFNIVEAATLEEGFAAVRREQVDCVIVDYYLPDGNGIDFISTIRKGANTARLPVLFVTGQEDPDVLSQAVKLGAGCLSKANLTKETLAQAVADAVNAAAGNS